MAAPSLTLLPGGHGSKSDLLCEIRRTFNTLLAERDVAELRGPKCPKAGTLSGYFNNADDFAEAAANWTGKVNLFLTINPVDPNLLARAANRVKPFARETTSDKDIIRRCWLPIDFDPVRPAGISSTDAEHNAALDRAEACRYALCNAYGIQSVLADSGNGSHVLLRLDLPNDQASATLCKAILAALATRFDDDVVKVDQACFNAARIIKIYGSLACKGDSTPARPHRPSRLLDVPAEIVPVPIEILQEIAAEAPQSAPKPTPARPASQTKTADNISRLAPAAGSFDIEAWMQRHGLSVNKAVCYNGGMKYQLCECPFDPSHKAPDSAVLVGADGKIGFKCMHNSCASRDWHALREHLEPAYSRQASTPKITAGDFWGLPSLSTEADPSGSADPIEWDREGYALAACRTRMDFAFRVAASRWYEKKVRGMEHGDKALTCRRIFGANQARQIANWCVVLRAFPQLAAGEIPPDLLSKPWSLLRVLAPIKDEAIRNSYLLRWPEKGLTVDIIEAELREAGHLQRPAPRVANGWRGAARSGVPSKIGDLIRDQAAREGARVTARKIQTVLGQRLAAPDLPGVKDRTAEEIGQLIEDLCERDGPQAVVALLRGAWCAQEETNNRHDTPVNYNAIPPVSPETPTDDEEEDDPFADERPCDQEADALDYEIDAHVLDADPDFDFDEPDAEPLPAPSPPLDPAPHEPRDFMTLRSRLASGTLVGREVVLQGKPYDAEATVRSYLYDLDCARKKGKQKGKQEAAAEEEATRQLQILALWFPSPSGEEVCVT